MQCSVQSILFFIAVLKTVTGNVEVIYAQVGHDVTLQVPAAYAKQRYKFWFFEKERDSSIFWINYMGGRGTADREPWKTQLSLSGDSLVIKGIQEANFGTYFYKVDPEATLAVTYQLYKVTVNVTPGTPLLPGDTMKLICKVDTRGQKQPAISWQTPHGVKRNDDLSVTVTSQDSGTWTCVVVNSQKKHEVKISVIVVDFYPAPQLQYTSTFSKLNIPFSIRTYNSWEKIKPLIKEIQWSFTPKTTSSQNPQELFRLSLKDRKNLIGRNEKELKYYDDNGNFSLSRGKGKLNDQGVYSISITFDTGKTLASTVQVEVLQIIASPGKTVTKGQRLELVCNTTESLNPNLKFKWYPPKTSSSFPNENSTLIIKEARTEDEGMWKCELWQNNTHLTSAAIQLKIEPILSVWMLVTICSAAAIAILLVVLTVILCRHRKPNGRRFRHQLCRCENPKPKGFYRT